MHDSLYFTDHHFQVRDMVRDFAQRVVKPSARRYDVESAFPWDNVRRMADLGLFGIPWPEELGGAGMDYLSYIIVIFFFLMIRRPPRSTLFPYTTLGRERDERPPSRIHAVPAHVVGPDLVVHFVREAHLDDAVDEGPQQVHRHRLVDAVLDRVQDEPEVRLRARCDDLEELRDRLRRVMEEQRRDCVEVDAHGRAELLRRLAHRHPDPLEVREARDEERLFPRSRLRTFRRGRAVAVDEHERLALDVLDVKAQATGPSPDLVRVEVERHEHDALAAPDRFLDLRDEVLELPDAGWAAQEDRVVRRESVLHLRAPRTGLPLVRSRGWADALTASMFRFLIYSRCHSSQP